MDPGIGKRTSRREFLKAAAVGTVLAGGVGFGAGCSEKLSERLSVEPHRTRGDEPFVVRLRHLSPGSRVVLSASLGGGWSSIAAFEADGSGVVDTSEQPPVAGSYRARDPMGLVWSASGPGVYAPPIRPSTVRIEARVGGERATKEADRYAMGRGVASEDVREEGLVGRLFYPEGSGRRTPGLLVLGGSEGGLQSYVLYEAALLASRGYAALALAYFKGDLPGSEDLPDELVRIPLEYFGRALECLGDRGGVDPGRLGVVGHSRGGELALLLGATYPKVRAVVSYVGSGAVASSSRSDEPAWTYRGKPLSRLPFDVDASSITDEELERARIPVEKTNGPVLLFAAGDDEVWPSERLSGLAMDSLRRAGRPYDDELAVYPNAGHLIKAPYVPTELDGPHFGGTPVADSEANENSWGKATALLDRALVA